VEMEIEKDVGYWESAYVWLFFCARGLFTNLFIVETNEKDPEKRKGRFHRAERDVVFSTANTKAFVQWVWVWMK
jgi:hypothetical protein